MHIFSTMIVNVVCHIFVLFFCFIFCFSFKKQEQYFNTYEHYLTNIEGIDIHFMHVKPKLGPDQKAKPLLISHGWPGSFYECYKVNFMHDVTYKNIRLSECARYADTLVAVPQGEGAWGICSQNIFLTPSLPQNNFKCVKIRPNLTISVTLPQNFFHPIGPRRPNYDVIVAPLNPIAWQTLL